MNSCDGNIMGEIHPRHKSDVLKNEVLQFLEGTKFSRYQSIELPYGLKTPGMNRQKSADLVFRYPVKDKSVLDIGCKYGYFCHEALKRGACEITGVEISDHNASVAKRIAELWNRKIEIRNTDFMSIPDSQKYDVVLFLNVMHHMLSPVLVMKKLNSIAREIVIVEFPTLFDRHTGFSMVKKVLLKTLFDREPIMYMGDKRYHRTWYFSKDAFLNLFKKQLNLFKKIDFENSPRKKGRLIAYCWK